jgi:hypothetical protein
VVCRQDKRFVSGKTRNKERCFPAGEEDLLFWAEAAARILLAGPQKEENGFSAGIHS